MKQIKVTQDELKRLQESFGVGRNYLWQVLSFAKHGPTAQKIRRAAIQMGGRYVDPEFVPTCTTEFKDGQIRHTFATGVVLSVDWKTGLAVITEGDKVVWKGENLNFLAQKAQQIVIRRVINA